MKYFKHKITFSEEIGNSFRYTDKTYKGAKELMKKYILDYIREILREISFMTDDELLEFCIEEDFELTEEEYNAYEN